jgi:hypothetical protein
MRYLSNMKWIFCILLSGICFQVSAQVTWSVTGGYGIGITEDGALDVNPEASYFGRAGFSGNLRVPGFRYNLGLEYGQNVWGARPAAQAGIVLVWLNPSGFLRAGSAEDVTYRNIPWFISTDINSFHGAVPVEDTWVYEWGIEPAIVVGRTLTKGLLLTSSVSYRFNYCPAYEQFGSTTSYSGLFLHLGLSYAKGRRFFQP